MGEIRHRNYEQQNLGLDSLWFRGPKLPGRYPAPVLLTNFDGGDGGTGVNPAGKRFPFRSEKTSRYSMRRD
jgi:hypothetical protein